MTEPRGPMAETEPEDPAKVATGMTLADISIRNHVFAWMLMAGLVLFGLICFVGFGDVVKHRLHEMEHEQSVLREYIQTA